MNRLLLKHFAYCALLVAAGFLCINLAVVACFEWLAILDLSFALIYFILAWLKYRKILRAAQVLDDDNEYRNDRIECVIKLMQNNHGKNESESNKKSKAADENKGADELAH